MKHTLACTNTELVRQKAILKDQIIAALNIAKDADETSKKLKKRTIELEQSNSELEQFACVASHDLQIPLRHILNYSYELLKADDLNLKAEERQRCVKDIIRGCNKMSKIINSLLNLAKVGKNQVVFECFCLKDEFEHIKDLFLNDIGKYGIRLDYFVDSELIGDRTLIRQLLQNLIENAIKFRKKTATPFVKVQVNRKSTKALISVKDNGIGIDSAMADQLFEIFQQAQIKGSYPGTGIGLSICKKIVALHGGNIEVKSSLSGSEFIISIPQD